MSNDASRHSTHISAKSRAAVEAKPPDPEKDSPDDNVRHVVRTIWQAMYIMVAPSFAKHDRVGQRSRARGNVNWSSSGKVETTKFVDPACRIPSPARDRIVDNGCPDEHEDDAGKHARTVDSCTNR